MSESQQHKLDRVRPPRVQITYDVEIGDAIEKKELPLVVGMMADLSGDNSGKEEILKTLKERSFIEIDRDNFSKVMDAQQPALEVKSADWLTKHELGMTKRIEELAKKAKMIGKDAAYVFTMRGCDKLLEGFVATLSDKDKMLPGMFGLNQMIGEYGELDHAVQDFLELMVRFMKTYQPLHAELEDTFHKAVVDTLSKMIASIGTGKVSDDYLTALTALKASFTPDNAVFKLRFHSVDDFSPLAIIKQHDGLTTWLQKKRKLTDLLHKLDGSPELLETVKGLVDGTAKAVDMAAIDKTMPDATDFQKSYVLTSVTEFQEAVKNGFLSVAIYKDKDTTDFIFETSYLINILVDRIADINERLTNQINAILHNNSFQKLEASWRALFFLVSNTETGTRLKLRLLNVSKNELQNDLEKATEFDQSQLFKKVYEAEYGTFGGHPYSLLLGDFEFGRSSQDIALLTLISGVAAAAHAPFISAAAPGLFDMASFSELAVPRDLSGLFESQELIKWNAFRDTEDSRYVSLILPHFLMRLPYGPNTLPVDGFDFTEDVDGKDHDKFLWANAAYALVQRITDAFAKYSWCAAIRGMEGGGVVSDLPAYLFTTDSGDQVLTCPTEVAITDRREKELSDLGFISLVHCKGMDFAAFFGGQTAQRPKKYDLAEATANARLSAVLPYILASSRFAHYMKSIIRDKVGGFLTADNVKTYLNRWIGDYVLGKDDAGQEVKARYPLREARVDVFEIPGKPGCYTAVVYLRPHFQLEELTTSIRLVAELPAPAA